MSTRVFDRGSSGFLDGRDLEASPPLTIRRVRLWDDVPRQRVVGQLPHGTRVRVLDRREHDGRTYYQVEARGGLRRRRGWVWSAFLSDRRHEPVGDWF